jgi:hypothetical protein
MTACRNCGAPLLGLFCHACGQKAVDAETGLYDFFHEALHEFVHLDGKIFQTLRVLLTKPGMLTWVFYRKARPFYVAHLY